MVTEVSKVDAVRADLLRRALQYGTPLGATISSRATVVDTFGDSLLAGPNSSTGMPEQFYNIFRHSILGAANLVPVVGGFLSYLGALFIPNTDESPEQMWTRLIDSKISGALFKKSSATWWVFPM